MSGFGKWRLAKAVALCVTLISLSPAALMAQETAGELGDISLGDLLNLKVSVATKSEMTLEEAPSIVSVITAKEIRNMGARSIVDVLRTVPGFAMTHPGAPPITQINIRGMRSALDNDKIKIMIDGHTMGTFYASLFLHFDALPLGSISRIEIIRGPGSALYGTGAFLGVVNIVSKKGGDGPSGISFEAGSYDTMKSYAELSYKNDDDLRAYLYADFYKTDGYDGTIESDMATNSPVFAPSASREMAGEGKYHTLQTNISYKDFYFSGFLQEMKDYDSPVSGALVLAEGSEADSLYAYAELGCKLPISEKGNLRLRAYHDYGDADYDWEIFPEETAAMEMHTGFPEGEALRGRPLFKQSVSGGEVTAEYEVYSGIQLVAGTSYEYRKHYGIRSFANFNATGSPIEIDGIVYPPFPYQYLGGMVDLTDIANWTEPAHRSVTAVYAQGIFNIKEFFSLEKGVKSLSFTTGLRYDHYSDVGSTLNPRLGVVYAPTEKLYFKTLYGTAFRAPAFRELYNKNNPAALGNKDIEPENIATFEGLIGYNFSDNIRANITYFDVSAEDLIQKEGKTFQNAGKMRSRGVEAELRMSFDKQKYAYLNMVYQDVMNANHRSIISDGGQVYTHGDFKQGSVPEIIANIGINYDISRHVIANMSLNYLGDIHRSEEKEWDGENLVQADQRKKIDAALLVNASLTFRNIFKGAEIQVSGFNLFDEDCRDAEVTGAIENDIPRPGRSFTARISYSF